MDRLSPREREVALLVHQGLHTDQIADRLCVSRQTVKNALWGAYRRLGLYESVNQRVALALLVERERAHEEE